MVYILVFPDSLLAFLINEFNPSISYFVCILIGIFTIMNQPWVQLGNLVTVPKPLFQPLLPIFLLRLMDSTQEFPWGVPMTARK